MSLEVLKILSQLFCMMGFPSGSVGKESACNAGDLQLDPMFPNSY